MNLIKTNNVLSLSCGSLIDFFLHPAINILVQLTSHVSVSSSDSSALYLVAYLAHVIPDTL